MFSTAAKVDIVTEMATVTILKPTPSGQSRSCNLKPFPGCIGLKEGCSQLLDMCNIQKKILGSNWMN